MGDREEIIREIEKIISSGDIQNGEVLLKEYRKNFESCDEIESMSAAVNLLKGNYEEALNNVRQGLKYNILNSDLYYTMGNIYESLEQYNRSYLCYENALYYCNNDHNKVEIINSINNLKENFDINVNKISFIILTYNQLEYTKVCIESIRKYNNPDTYEIIIVDNHSTDGTVEWLKVQNDIKVIYNNDNLGFPKGCNQGIEIADKNNDIMLLNNDTVLMVNSIFNLRMGLYSDKNIGATGAVSNSVSNCQMISESFNNFDDYIDFANKNNIPNDASYEERAKLVGFAMLIKRNVLEEIGYLDERFTPGNFEDDDLSLRIIMNGNKILLCKDAYIHHFGSVSFRNVNGGYNELLQKNSKKFSQKWTFNAYESQRFYKTIFKYIDNNDKNILEINAGGGSNLVSIRNEFPNRNYFAYEKNKKLVELNKKFNINIIDNLDDIKYRNYFDLIIITDYDIVTQKSNIEKIKNLLNENNSRVIAVLDAYKENKNSFLNCEVEKFLNDFSANNFKMIDYYPIGENDNISICTALFENITEYQVTNETLQILNNGKITTAMNYLTMLENDNTFNNIGEIRKNLKSKFDIYINLKFLLRRIDLKMEDSESEIFEVIDKNQITDEAVIGMVNEDMLDKVYVLNYLAIEYFAREKFDRVLPYLKEALAINREDLDTVYNIAYVLNCFGEKKKALEYLENVKEKNQNINELIVEIRK